MWLTHCRFWSCYRARSELLQNRSQKFCFPVFPGFSSSDRERKRIARILVMQLLQSGLLFHQIFKTHSLVSGICWGQKLSCTCAFEDYLRQSWSSSNVWKLEVSSNDSLLFKRGPLFRYLVLFYCFHTWGSKILSRSQSRQWHGKNVRAQKLFWTDSKRALRDC